MSPSSPSLNLIAVGILLGGVQILFLLYFFLRKGKTRSYTFAMFMGLLLISQVEAFLNRSGYMTQTLFLLNISTPFVFLFGPLLYFHTSNSLGQKVSTKQLILHSLPFVLYFGYSFFFFLQPETYKYDAYVSSFQPDMPLLGARPIFDTDPLELQGLVVVELLSLHILLYSAASLLKVRQFKLSNPGASVSWLYFMNALLASGGFILLLSQGGVVNGNRFFQSLIPHFSADLYPTLATYAVFFYFLRNGLTTGVKLPKYYKSGISKELRNKQLERIIKAIEEDKLYMTPGLSLQSLSDACNLSAHHISQVLNEEMGCTFFELINKYRIEEAKRRLTETSDYIKMEQLAYELGYKSKSTFFTAFKKATDLTPSKFRDTASI